MNMSSDNPTGTLQISGMLDIYSANSLREALLDCFLQQPEITVDLSEVTGCDAAALQVLLAGRKEAAAGGKTFRVSAASRTVSETAAALGFSLGSSDNGSGGNHPNAS